MIERGNRVEKIEKITIADEDMPGWIRTLYEGGFSDSEIDAILGHLNATYAGKKREEYINRELSKMESEIARRRGSGFTDEEKEAIRKGIESRFNIQQSV